MLPKIGKIILAILICQAAGIVGTFVTPDAVNSEWFINLNKPIFYPPNWLFGPVWIFLYTLMGISLYLIWQNKKVKTQRGYKDNQYYKSALLFFYIQLVLNALWSFLFFGLRMVFVAFIEITILWLAIIMTMLFFSKIKKTAWQLLIPYLLWVTFAAVLNFSIWWLN